jgi:hypothetical protein
MDSEFVKECTSLLQAAEILCPEISSFLKIFFFFATAVACEDVVACSVVIVGRADVTDINHIALFIQVVNENCPYKPGP